MGAGFDADVQAALNRSLADLASDHVRGSNGAGFGVAADVAQLLNDGKVVADIIAEMEKK